MRTLIIPDIHNQIENAEYWLRTQHWDRVVFLGDYFDSFDDNVNDARRTATWLRDRMDRTNDIFLLGNHDLPYWFPNAPEVECPGFTRPKAAAIREILERRHWHRFELAWEEQGWLLSHAGFHPTWIDQPSVRRILARCAEAMELARRGKIDPVLGFGEKQHGFQGVGGPLWTHWGGFAAIPGINQIVGHTQGAEVREKIGEQSRNYCIDVGGAKVAALLCDGELEILER